MIHDKIKSQNSSDTLNPFPNGTLLYEVDGHVSYWFHGNLYVCSSFYSLFKYLANSETILFFKKHNYELGDCPPNCKAGKECKKEADLGCPECDQGYYGRQCQHRMCHWF